MVVKGFARLSAVISILLLAGVISAYISVTLVYPPNSSTNNQTSPFNFTFVPNSNETLTSCALFANDTGSWTLKVNNQTTILNASNNNLSSGFSSNGTYLWNVQCNDSTGNSTYAPANFTLTYTGVMVFPPNVSLNWPYVVSIANNTNTSFNYSVTGSNITGCTLWTNMTGTWSSSNKSNLTAIDTANPNYIAANVSVGAFPSTVVWNVNCSNIYTSGFSPANASFAVVPPAAANITVWDQTYNSSFYDGGQTKQANENVTIYANYTYAANGLPVINSSNSGCNITTYNHTNASMAFNQTGNALYSYNEVFNATGGNQYNVTCFNDGANQSYGGGAASIQPQTIFIIYQLCNKTVTRFQLDMMMGPFGTKQNNVTVTTETNLCSYYSRNGSVYTNVTETNALSTNVTNANYSERINAAGLGSTIHLTHYINNGTNCNGTGWFMLQNDTQQYVWANNFSWLDNETKCLRTDYSIGTDFNGTRKFDVINSLNFTPIAAIGENMTMRPPFMGPCADGICALVYNATLDNQGPIFMMVQGAGGTSTLGDYFYHINVSAYIPVENANYGYDVQGACRNLWLNSPANYTQTNRTVNTTGFYCFPAIDPGTGTPDVFTAVKVIPGTYVPSCDGGAGCGGPPTRGSMAIRMRTDAPPQFILPKIDPFFDTNVHNVTILVTNTTGNPVLTGANVSAFATTSMTLTGPVATNSTGYATFTNILSDNYVFVAYGTNPATYNQTLANQMVNGTQVGYNFTIANFDDAAPVITYGAGTTAAGNYSTPISINISAVDANLDRVIVFVNGTVANNCATSSCNVSLVADGTYVVYATANDTVGHLSQTANRTYIKDTSKPQIIVFNPQNNSLWNATPTLNYTIISATLDSTWYSLNGGANTTVAGNVTLAASTQGANNITVFANNSFGNTNQTGPIFFTFDNQPPSIDFVAGTNSSGNYSSNQLANFSASDTASLNRTEIRVNGVLNTTCTATQYCSVLLSTEGTYSVFATAFDNVGNTNVTSSRNYTIDRTKPTIIVTSPQNNTWYNTTTVNLNYSAIDPNLNTSWFVFDGGANNYTGNATFSSLAQGAHTVQVFANDSAGNLNQSIVLTFFVDSIVPILTVTSPINTSFVTNPIWLNYTATDANWRTIWYVLSNGTNQTSNYSLVNGTQNLQIAALDGTNTLTVNINDSASNINSTARTFYLDARFPQVQFNSTTPVTGYYNTTISVNVTATDDTQVNYTLISVNNTNTTQACGTPYCTTTTVIAGEGNYSVYGWANDTVGKVNSTATRTYTIDLTAPVVAITNPANGTWLNTANGTVNFTVVEAYYNYSTLSVNGSAAIPAVNGTAIPLAGDGNWYVTVTAHDLAGNSGSAVAYLWRDTSAPLVQFAPSATPAGFRNASVNVNVTATDLNLSNIVIFVNGTTAITCTSSPCNYTISADGTYNVSAFANDTTGHSNVTGSNIYVIDTAKPQLVVTAPVNATAYNSTVPLTFSVIDSYLNRTWFVLNGAINQTNGNITGLSPLLQGWNNVTAYANDSAGNQNNSQLISFFFDNQAPQLAFAPNADAGGFSTSSVNVNFTVTDANVSNVIIYVNGTAQTNCAGSATTSCNLTIAAPGTYNVSAYAIDGSGNINTTVNRTYILDFTPPTLVLYSPLNNSAHSATSVLLQYNASDTYLQSVWYSLDGGANTLLGANITLVGLSQGAHNLTISANDSAGNVNNNGLVLFTVDTVKPTIVVTSPLNGSIHNATNPVVTLNYTAVDANLNRTWFVLNGVTNLTQGNLTLASIQGTNTVTVFANDSAGNQNQSQQITFFVDSQGPQYLATASNSTAHNQSVLLSAYWTDGLALGYAWLSTNNTGTWLNSSPIALAGTLAYSNFTTTLNATSGKTVQWLVYANDTTGNLNATQIQNITTTNTPPVMLANPVISNYTPATTDTINCTAGTYSDADGDALAATYYKWYMNGTRVSAVNTLNLSTVSAMLADNFTCSVIVFDGVANSTEYNSSKATVGAAPDITAPTYSNLLATNTQHGQSATLSALWNDNSGLGYLNGSIFSTNNTGAWVNGSFTSFAGTGYSNTTLTLTAVNGASVGWRIYAVDLSGNWNDTGIQNIVTTNTAPTLTTNPTITPGVAYRLDSLTCNAGTYADANGDALTKSYWQWYRNGTILGGSTGTVLSLEAAGALNNDNFSCSQIVNDGIANSTVYNSTNRSITAQVVPPILSVIASGSVTYTGATISWNTDTSSNSAVYYGTDPANLSSQGTSATNVTAHAVALAGLTASTNYSYIASSCDRYGNCANGTIANFTTAAAPAPTPTPTPTPAAGGATSGNVYVTSTNGVSPPSTGGTTTSGPSPTPTGPSPTAQPVGGEERSQVLQEVGLPTDSTSTVYRLDTQTESATTTSGAVEALQTQLTDPQAQRFISAIKESLSAGTSEPVTVGITKTAYRVNTGTEGSTFEQRLTSITITIRATRDTSEIRVVQIVPKSVAQSIANILFSGLRPEVLQADPVFAWTISNLKPGEQVNLTYSVRAPIDAVKVDTLAVAKAAALGVTPKPTAAVTILPGAIPSVQPQDNTWIYVVFGVLIVIIGAAMVLTRKHKR